MLVSGSHLAFFTTYIDQAFHTKKCSVVIFRSTKSDRSEKDIKVKNYHKIKGGSTLFLNSSGLRQSREKKNINVLQNDKSKSEKGSLLSSGSDFDVLFIFMKQNKAFL